MMGILEGEGIINWEVYLMAKKAEDILFCFTSTLTVYWTR